MRRPVAIRDPDSVEKSKYFALRLSKRALIVGPLMFKVPGPKSNPKSLLSGSIGPALTVEDRTHSGARHSKILTYCTRAKVKDAVLKYSSGK